MFERYTETARRTLFFARYEATQAGNTAIEPHHLLQGVLREDKSISALLEHLGLRIEAIRDDLARIGQYHPKVTTGIEIPFTSATKLVLQYAAEEADGLESRDITPWHLLLGILREAESKAARLLTRLGMQLEAARTATSQLRSGEALGPSAHVPRPDVLPAGPPFDEKQASIPPSTEVRVSVSKRHGTSSTRGLHYWFLEGFSFVGALAKIYDFPASRIDCVDAAARNGQFDLHLLLPAGPVIAPHPHLDGAMQSAVERHFAIAVVREPRRLPVLVLTAPSGATRAPQMSSGDVGGFAVWTSDWIEQEPGDARADVEAHRRMFEDRLRMFREGRRPMPPPGSAGVGAGANGSMTMEGLCEMLESALGRPVVDDTNLTGTFEVQFRASSGSVEDVAAALHDQLDLELNQAEREVTFLVVKPA